MNKYAERVYNGLIKENPTFVLMLGMCPTLAVTTSAINGAGMGLTTTAVLIMSNFMISLFICYYCANGTKSILFFIKRSSRNLHSVNRCKLYYLRTCGSLCLKKHSVIINM